MAARQIQPGVEVSFLYAKDDGITQRTGRVNYTTNKVINIFTNGGDREPKSFSWDRVQCLQY